MLVEIVEQSFSDVFTVRQEGPFESLELFLSLPRRGLRDRVLVSLLQLEDPLNLSGARIDTWRRGVVRAVGPDLVG